MSRNFQVSLTCDFMPAEGEPDVGLDLLRAEACVEYQLFRSMPPAVAPEQITGFDALLLGGQLLTREILNGRDMRLAILARLGVGYDRVDVKALTDNDILLTITPDGIRRPMATAIVTLILALSHEVAAKDRLFRAAGWARRLEIEGRGVVGRTVGSVGVGNIGKELFRLLQPFGMVHLATDPFTTPESVAGLQVELTDLETLMRKSDFVCVNCPLMPETQGLIGEREIGWMKPTAYLINTARGPIVDQKALTLALQEKRIRGAGLDVFEKEPPEEDDPLLKLDNVLITPHSLGVTDQCLRGTGESALRSVLSVFQGEVPPFIVNREVLDRPGFRKKLEANRQQWASS